MSNTLRNLTLAAALVIGTLPMISVQADAKKSAFMADCSAKFKAAKAAGTLNGMKWTDFMKTQCAADAAAAPVAPAVAATPVVPAKVVAPAAPAVATTTTPSGSFMQNCSAAWKALKSANNVPTGMDWHAFVKAKCVVDGSAAAAPAAPAAPVAVAPIAPTKTVAVAPTEPTTTTPDTSELKTVDKNGKPFTPAQMAAHKRARECGNQWRAAKAGNTVPAGQKWPQYWHECSMRLKAAVQ